MFTYHNEGRHILVEYFLRNSKTEYDRQEVSWLNFVIFSSTFSKFNFIWVHSDSILLNDDEPFDFHFESFSYDGNKLCWRNCCSCRLVLNKFLKEQRHNFKHKKTATPFSFVGSLGLHVLIENKVNSVFPPVYTLI